MDNKTNDQGGEKQPGEVVAAEGYSSEELAEQSAYSGETETARQMRRGDESKGDADDRDVAGASDPQDISPDVSSDKKRPA
ncbi:MAG TPA: hypothetical protein VNA17_05020 [Pyrinomonadaceae bacterium]|nr:hypothetical protein [Pyrinomonadaceae bacterium]